MTGAEAEPRVRAFLGGAWERGMRIPTFLLPCSYSLLSTPISQLPSPDSHLPTPISRLPSPDSHLPTPISRLPSPDSRPGQKQAAKARPIGKDQFPWVPEQNMYRCPEGHPMPWIGHQKRRQSDGQVNVMHSHRCSPQHCRACPRQAACSTNPNRGRSVKRSEHEALVEAHRARMATAEAKSLYRLRGQTVELGFADFKQHRSLRQFSGRGPIAPNAKSGRRFSCITFSSSTAPCRHRQTARMPR